MKEKQIKIEREKRDKKQGIRTTWRSVGGRGRKGR